MIEILLATYNGGNYLREQLDSLFAQTVQDFKILVRDDGSNDNTVSILNEYCAKYPNRMDIKVNNPPTGNAKDNFFLLMQDATADYVMFCDQDDKWLSDKIEKTFAKMQELPQDKPALVHTDLFVADKDLNILKKSFFRMQHYERRMKLNLHKALAQNTVTGCTVMINKCLCDMAKTQNHTDVIMHDWWLACVAAAFGNVAVVKKPTVLYRQHSGNAVGAKTVASKIKGAGKLYERLCLTYRQADLFAQCFKNRLSEQEYNAVKEYGSCTQGTTLKKVCRVMKNGFTKQTLSARIIQFFVMLFQ